MKVKYTLPGGALVEVEGTPVEVKTVLRDLIIPPAPPVCVPSAWAVRPCLHEYDPSGLQTTGGPRCKKCGASMLSPTFSYTTCTLVDTNG